MLTGHCWLQLLLDHLEAQMHSLTKGNGSRGNKKYASSGCLLTTLILLDGHSAITDQEEALVRTRPKHGSVPKVRDYEFGNVNKHFGGKTWGSA